tara:strand:- start:610 stop:1122 length:513 start_codon:yes stop_codon:yes gene_type:complete
MAEKVYEPEVVQDTPFPGQDTPITSSVAQSASGGTYNPATTKEKSFPKKRTAVELIGQALNTRSRKILKEFELTQSGGFQVGDFKQGISGDLRITPNGLTARDTAGVTTFAIDGLDGSAIFKGTVQAGSLIAGVVTVGDNRIIIDGDKMQILISDGANDRVLIGFDKDGF